MIPDSERVQKYVEFLDKVRQCVIDKEGLTFKYILIRVEPKTEKPSDPYPTKHLVRGFGNCVYHCDILDEVETAERFEVNGFAMHCLGGGRIRHDKKKLQVYGYSQGYGKADHEFTKVLLQKEFPDYEIICSDEGY